MAVKAKKSAAAAKVIRLRGKALPSLDREVVLVRVGKSKRPRGYVDRSGEADVIVRKLGKALSKPGISKHVVFHAHAPKRVFAYSVYPKDVTKVVRQSADGTRTVGRVVGGKFRAV
jgi:hypothetical protein